MTRQEQAKLRTKIREVLAELQAEGRVTTTALAESIIERFPDICEAEKDRLFREAIATAARQIMKSTSDAMKSAQYRLPGVLADIKAPSHIGIEKVFVDAESGEKIHDVEWIPFEDVTYAELGSHLQMLFDGIKKDQARYETLLTVHNFLRPHMDSEDHRDEPIGPMLAEIAAQEGGEG